jgi:flavin reductase (DIM6/NTAB) family NADH-FMN oxidoreductase RutF
MSVELRRLLDPPRVRPVPLCDPQQEVEVWLSGAGDPINVTANNVIAALRPLTIAVMFSGGAALNLNQAELRLCMREATGKSLSLGAIDLRFTNALRLSGDHQLCLFEANGSENCCMPVLNMWLYRFLAKSRAKASQRSNEYNFQMTQTDLGCFDVFYICPRPVVLVTAEHAGTASMFPMDLIGPTGSSWFTLALRNTSAAAGLMEESRRIALTSVPWALKDLAYELGKYHELPGTDWNALPVKTKPSALFGLPVLEGMPGVREVRIEQSHKIGSHTLFITRIEQEAVGEQVGLQLFHKFGARAATGSVAQN